MKIDIQINNGVLNIANRHLSNNNHVVIINNNIVQFAKISCGFYAALFLFRLLTRNA